MCIYVCMCVYMFVCVYMCVYVCMHMCIVFYFFSYTVKGGRIFEGTRLIQRMRYISLNFRLPEGESIL